MKLVDALRFSHERKAWHPDDQMGLYASDYGLIEFEKAQGSCIREEKVTAWHDVLPNKRRSLLDSEDWEPVDPKDPLIVLAEAMDDWRDPPEEIE